MTKQKVSFSDFIGLILLKLYEIDKNEKYGNYIQLKPLLENLKIEYPYDWLLDAARVMEARGLTNNIYEWGGHVAAKISGEGRLFVEEKRQETEDNIIKKYDNNPRNYNIVIGSTGTQIIQESSKAIQKISLYESRKEMFDILGEIKTRITKLESLSEDQKEDLKIDLQSIENQLKKKEPNRTVLSDLLEPFGKIIEIASLVSRLIAMINF